MLEKKFGIGLIAKLKSQQNKTKFLAFISEINFALFFEPLATSLKFGKLPNGQTPDWEIEINSQRIIAEVVRLNPSESDQKQLNFEDEFMHRIEGIKIGCGLFFDYEDGIKMDISKIEYLKQEIEQWLKDFRMPNDSLILSNKIKITFIAYSNAVDHVCLAGGGGSIKFDYRRLASENSRLVEKSTTYNAQVEEQNLPYIICLYMDYHTWFDKDDVYNHLYGFSTQHHEFGQTFYSHLIKNALYYSPNQFMKNVSGVLLRHKDEYTFFYNYSCKNRLNEINKDLFLKWQYQHL